MVYPSSVLTASLLSANTGSTPFFINLVSAGQLASNLFSIFLSRQPDPNITSEVMRIPRLIQDPIMADTSCFRYALGALTLPSFRAVSVYRTLLKLSILTSTYEDISYYPLTPDGPNGTQSHWTISVWTFK